MNNLKEKSIREIEVLIKKAGNADKSDDALKFSQAACNTANAYAALVYTEK